LRSKLVAEVLHQVDLVAPFGEGIGLHQLGDQRIVGPRDGNAFGVLLELAHARAVEVIGAGELLALADGPDHGGDRQGQALLDLVQEVEGVARLAVHLVDEGDDGNVAQPADLEELARSASMPLAASITITAASTAVSVR
jgi:hypothetical protein